MKTIEKVVAWAVCVLSLASSVVGLWHVCIELAKMPELIAAGTIAAFDGSALVFGLKVARNPKEAIAWVGVIACASLSAAAQILAAPPDAGYWGVLHGAVAIGAIWTLHNAVKEDKPPKRGRASKDGVSRTRSKGAGGEATGVGLRTTAFAGPLAAESEHDASVLQLDVARREGDRRASGHDAGPPIPRTVPEMADRVAPLLGEADPSQRRVWDLCKSIDPGWTQADGRAVSALLKQRKEKTG